MPPTQHRDAPDLRYAEQLAGPEATDVELRRLARAIRDGGGCDKFRAMDESSRRLLLKPHYYRRPDPAIALESKLSAGGLAARNMTPQQADARVGPRWGGRL